MPSAKQRGERAEEWAAELFDALGYRVIRQPVVRGLRLDLVVEKDGIASPVEVKVRVQGRPIAMREVREQAVRLLAASSGARLVAPIFVLIGRITPQARSWSQNEFSLRVWDLDELRKRAKPFPALLAQLELLAEDQLTLPPQDQAVTDEGVRLITCLEAHLLENTLSSREYEELCQEVFVHLFDPDLYGFQRQAETTDGGNRYDFICRIKSGNLFWDGLRHDFRTKAILFECKNYEEGIGPDQVYSTERYLFSGALRTVCFLISRIRPTDGAIRAAQGAMRESGKLVLLLSNEDLIEMLRLKSEPEGPENYLDERIWNFVISLPR